MNGGVRVDLVAGSSVLLPKGVRVVVSVNPTGVVVKDFSGDATTLLWADLQTARRVADGRVDAVALPVASLLAGLSKPARDAALDRLEVVQTILTGYANGHPALAREGEPFSAFDPKGGFSERARCLSMAALLESEAAINRRAQRAREDRERRPYESIGGTALRTIQAWVQAYNDPVNGGVLALIDGRSKKSHKDFASLDPELMRVADEVLSAMDGTQSLLEINELYRRTRLALNCEGLHDVHVPEATLRAYLSRGLNQRGRTTRRQTTTRLRGAMAVTSYPALRPGQVVAVDVTRADNFVVDPWTGEAISVEIMTALDVSSRVALALRVVPRSATSIEAGLLLYDVLRPFSQAVSKDRADDWRWAGAPEFFGPISNAVVKAEELSVRPLIGEHVIPGVLPEAIRADHGSIFTSRHFMMVCDRLDIHLLLAAFGAHCAQREGFTVSGAGRQPGLT
ncbi:MULTISPECIES: hypothetical protein [Dermacoccus]|uniref:hypothetical protein n=1 Tax=Dermacoccus TaxID=57495 RepID=UPI000A87C10D|nr:MULTISPECIES: hypothetical protein [Dermacoccus]MBZ4498708.1 hypothetical protein [Dermacoccus sp. Tok2021]RYI21367.1 hypothetical protein EVU97_10970 [Dermacoccus sp. 147Ba]